MAERLSGKNGMSDTLDLQAIITGVKMDFNLHCKIPFGDYDKVYEKTGNDMNQRTVATIFLAPT